MNFAVLASGSKGNCTIIQAGDTTIMLDCGTTKKYLFQRLEELEIKKENIDALVITHDHSDHISQLKQFLDLTIYAPIEVDAIHYNEVKAYRPFQIKDIEVMPLALSHDAYNTMGYVFTYQNEKLVYVTDTGYISEKNKKHIHGSDAYIIEANHDIDMLMSTRRPQFVKSRIFGDSGHLCNEDCAEILNQVITSNTKFIVLAHLSQEANTKEKALQVVKDVLINNPLVHKDAILCVSGQYEMIQKGVNHEKVDLGTVRCAIGLESGINSTGNE